MLPCLLSLSCFRQPLFHYDCSSPLLIPLGTPHSGYVALSTRIRFILMPPNYEYRGVYRVPLFKQSVRLCVCVTFFVVSLIARAVRDLFPQTRDLWKRASMGYRVAGASSHAVSRWSRSQGCCRFRGVFWVWQDFVFSPVFFLRTLNAHGLLQVWGFLASFTSLLVMRPFFAHRHL